MGNKIARCCHGTPLYRWCNECCCGHGCTHEPAPSPPTESILERIPEEKIRKALGISEEPTEAAVPGRVWACIRDEGTPEEVRTFATHRLGADVYSKLGFKLLVCVPEQELLKQVRQARAEAFEEAAKEMLGKYRAQTSDSLPILENAVAERYTLKAERDRYKAALEMIEKRAEASTVLTVIVGGTEWVDNETLQTLSAIQGIARAALAKLEGK